MNFDADVLIWAMRGNRAAAQAVQDEPVRELSVVAYMELVSGARDKADLQGIQAFVSDLAFRVLPLSEGIGSLAAKYMEEHGLVIGMDPADALIAATAVENRLPLCTGNYRHYRLIRELQVKPFKP